MEHNVPIIKGIGVIAKSKNAIKKTKKGYLYKITNERRFFKRATPTEKFSLKRGEAVYFGDFGSLACCYRLSYRPGPEGKLQSTKGKLFWFTIKNGRLAIFKKSPDKSYATNMSNSPEAVRLSVPSSPRRKTIDNRFDIMISKWLRRNNIVIPNKYKKASLNTRLLIASYPEIVYLLDCGIKFDQYISSVLTRDIRRARGFNHILDRVFGTHGKSIKHILANSSNYDSIFNTGKLLKGLIPTDNLIKVLSGIRNDVSTGHPFRLGDYSGIQFYAQARRFLKQFHADTIYNWFSNKSLNSILFRDTVFRDTVKQYEEMKGHVILNNSNNLRDVHDYISTEYRKVKNKLENDKFRLGFEKKQKRFAGVNNKVFQDFRFEVPDSPEKLITYGQKLNNCIYSYRKSFADDTGLLLLGVYKKDELLYNISVENGNISQFCGNRNGSPLPEDKEIILRQLEILEVLKPKHFSSQPVEIPLDF